MEILFCGTAAAEGIPALFCECGLCAEARKKGGKDVRSRAAYMVGEKIRIDFGPDSHWHMQRYGLDFSRLEHLLVTHSHDDHWIPIELLSRKKGFSQVPDRPFQIYGNEAVEKAFLRAALGEWGGVKSAFQKLKAFQEIRLDVSLAAIPIPAAHDRKEECVTYLLRSGGRHALIAHDTGWYDAPSWDFLNGKDLDLLAMDATFGPRDIERGHMGGLALVRFRDELAKRKGLSANAKVFATHFSHNGGALHDALEDFFKPHGIEVAYDGMRVTWGG